ncbi:MAG: nuclear transport factor 2 family protein [Pseudomonadota bacterium]
MSCWLVACASLPIPGQPSVKSTAQEFLAVYAARNDFEALMDYYADEAQLEDLIFGHLAENKAQISAFLNWNDGKFSLPDGPPALRTTNLNVDGNTVVAQGHFTPFYYDGNSHGPWKFVIILEFNGAGKIIKQTDWINYTPRNKFLGGENRNLDL